MDVPRQPEPASSQSLYLSVKGADHAIRKPAPIGTTAPPPAMRLSRGATAATRTATSSTCTLPACPGSLRPATNTGEPCSRPLTSTMAEAGPPPNYDDSVAGSSNRFREYFATLSSDQLDIQQLFETVAEKLKQAPGIGETHPLCSEWNALRKVRTELLRLYPNDPALLIHATRVGATEAQTHISKIAAQCWNVCAVPKECVHIVAALCCIRSGTIPVGPV